MSAVTFERLPRELIMEIYRHLSNRDMLNILTLDRRVYNKTRSVFWIKSAQAIMMREFGIDASSVNNPDVSAMARQLIMRGMHAGYYRDIYLQLLNDYLMDVADEKQEIFQRVLLLATNYINNKDELNYAIDDFYEDADVMDALLHMNALEVYLVTGLGMLFSRDTFYPRKRQGAFSPDRLLWFSDKTLSDYPDLHKQIHSQQFKVTISRHDYITVLNEYVHSYTGISDFPYYDSIFESLLDYLKTIDIRVLNLPKTVRSRLERTLLTYRQLRQDGEYDQRMEFFMAALSLFFIEPQI